MNAVERRVEPAPIGVNETMLYRALLGLFLAGGFKAVTEACHRQQKRLAKEHRQEVDGQGWIV